MIVRIARQALSKRTTVVRVAFSGGHRPYDWREDDRGNPDKSVDINSVGTVDPLDYQFPYMGRDPHFPQNFYPEQYNYRDLTTNFTGKQPMVGFDETNLMNSPEATHMDDLAHEFNYASEDMDFQPDNPNTQHFRKKGFFLPWLVYVMFAPAIAFIHEVFYGQYFNNANWRFQRPPPLDFPNKKETPDSKRHALYKTKAFQELWELGRAKDPYFDIVEGKKVYSKWAGVNEPGERMPIF